MNVPVPPPSGKKSRPLSAIFDLAPALNADDAKMYEELLEQYSSAIKADDIFERIWLRDLVDCTFEIFQLRMTKHNLVQTAMYDALAKVLEPLAYDNRDVAEMCAGVGSSAAEALAGKFYSGDESAVSEVGEILARAKLTMENVRARAFANDLGHISQFETLISALESRRNAAKRELDRHREQKAKRALPPADDADFEVIETAPASDDQ